MADTIQPIGMLGSCVVVWDYICILQSGGVALFQIPLPNCVAVSVWAVKY